MPTKSDRSCETATPAELVGPARRFVMAFSSTPRGVRLARRLVAHRLHEWGLPYGGDPHDALTLITGELCANAIRHGHVPGRDFRVRLTANATTARVEVRDPRPEALPSSAIRSLDLCADDTSIPESGRGLLLVVGIATRWGWYSEPGRRGKTVWAELRLDADAERAASTPLPPGRSRTGSNS